MDLLLYHPLKSTPFLHSLPSTSSSRNRPFPTKWSKTALPCVCSSKSSSLDVPEKILSQQNEGRRAIMGSFIIASAAFCLCDVAGATSTSRRALRGAKIPESEYTTLPNGLKYYDLKVGTGAEAVKGSRVAVHYVAKWRNITFMTSRQGMGVGGGTPYGFDVGQSERGNVLKGLDLGVQGMRVGGQRLLIVPPELAYGKKGVQEIPPNATIEMDIELLSIKQSPFGTPVKVVEG
ncbi:peptidyl-prolyl cis-trans isomerase FKBP16-4, chloroplastic [Lycium barbarum]|uniref:peptidyl-prolyl cis-trans isomerase FKBP16-4, chloroplastic n=1 Tax=Lycium ferocissimum TaxID=112874 RepID=UPI002815D5E2|nr:peptidyl-prolyl cis-trans isomerase FKBP16-4, chloroplastic [Lycium ferocissimum]XP_060201379.1 peptidyl-prolyl cis-trans isomerase FKBP16-4, chloroplastic [Lycium barbarum]